MVNFDGWESVIMDAHNFFALEQSSGARGVIGIHREIAANGQDDKFEFGCFADEFHVQGQRRIAGVIKISFRGFEHEAAGNAAVGTIRERAGVNGVNEFCPAKIERITAARIQRMCFLDPVFAQPLDDFEVGNDRGAGLSGEFNYIRQVIVMGMGNEDIVCYFDFLTSTS